MKVLRSVFWNAGEARLRAGWRLLLQIVLLILLQIGMLAPLGLLIEPEGALGSSISMVMVLLGFVLSIWLAGRFLDRRRFRDFGFRVGPEWWVDLGFGLALGALLMAGIFVIERALGWVTVVETFDTAGRDVPFPIAILSPVFLFISVGIYEELWSRGYQLKNLAEGLNFKFWNARVAIVLATLITSVLFGLLHAGNPNATTISTLNIMLAGVFLALGFLLTGELAIPIGLHIAWNFFQGNVFGFSVSGTGAGPTFIAIQQGGPDLWTGGPFGPEAGLIGIGAMVLGSLLTVGWVAWRYGQISLHLQLTEPELLPRAER
ncbi:MAG TPA: CPBP family intramembrane metalloprotease [Chloroflexi bacterium]|nr:CPBP family intramembrane metalloprotease [Chloroflexota bacterium]